LKSKPHLGVRKWCSQGVLLGNISKLLNDPMPSTCVALAYQNAHFFAWQKGRAL